MNKFVLAAGVFAVFCGLLVGYTFWVASADGDEAGIEDQTTTTTEPGDLKEIPDGPYAEELRELVRNIDMSGYLGDSWNVSLVLNEYLELDGSIRIKSSSGIDTLVPATSDDCQPETHLATTVEPGDLIVWSNLGEDRLICPGELTVVALKEDL